MIFLTPDWPGLSVRVKALSTYRYGGVSDAPYDGGEKRGGLNISTLVGDRLDHVLHNRAQLRTYLPNDPVWLSQVHGREVVDAASIPQGTETFADASVTNTHGVVCAVQTADCLPVLFSDQAGTVVAAAHAGWRGLASGILEHTVTQMRAQGAKKLQAWLGPAIGPEKFEVGEDVLHTFVEQNSNAVLAFQKIEGRDGKYRADIYCLARQRLNAIGVHKISGGTFCTVTDEDHFFSYRRDSRTGRMVSLIWIDPLIKHI